MEWIPYSKFDHINPPKLADVVFLFLNAIKKRFNEEWYSEPTHFLILPSPPKQKDNA